MITFSGIFGLLAYILMLLTFLLSFFTLKVKILFKTITKRCLYLMHVTLAIVSYITGVIDLLLGVFSGWFEKNASTTAQVCCTLLMLTLVINVLWIPISRRLIKPLKAKAYSYF